MGQLTVYSNKDELIKWLQHSLIKQRHVIAKETKRNKSDVEDKELILNIGYPEYEIKDGHLVSTTKAKTKVEINFDFNFKNIISEVLDIKKDNEKYLCPHYLNCCNVTFKGGADFKRIVFEEKAYFTYSVFKGEADFKWVEFKKTDYDDYNCTFNNTCLYERCAFWGISIDGALTFENIKLTDKSNIYFGDIDNEEATIAIVNTVINGRIDFNDLEIKEIDFEKSIVVGNGVVTRINLKAECANWETARLIKHEAYKMSNTIKGLKYKAIEKDLYLKELLEETAINFRALADISSILLSKLSNNHGQNWWQAVIFTIVSGLIFFTFSITPMIFTDCFYIIFGICFMALINLYISNKLVKWYILICCLPFLYEAITYLYELIPCNISYINSFFAYLIPTNFDGIIQNKSQNFINTFFMSGEKNTTTYSLFQSLDGIEKIFSYTTYIMGKIVMGYGIVEIVQAFRKLNSK